MDDHHEALLAVAMAKELDRERIREEALERFSLARMVDEYETVYERVIDSAKLPSVRTTSRSPSRDKGSSIEAATPAIGAGASPR